jgi:hypothetical protein
MRITRIIAATFAAAALVVPAAQAAVPPDMHAKEAIALTKSHQTKQDLRSPDARDVATLRLHRSGVVVGQNPVPGQPTWPVDPQPITPVAPAAAAPQATDDGIDWQTIGIGVAACLVALAGIGLVLNRRPQKLRTVA